MNQSPTANSTAAYRHEIRVPQSRHFPRNNTQLKTGRLSHHRTICPQLMQCDRGVTMLSPLGTRTMQTFKKLPRKSPIKNPETTNTASEGFTPEVYV
jgi:hypothetical protein